MALNEDEWEEFIKACAEQLRTEGKYVLVKHLGGAGDKGRDIGGYSQIQALEDTWDLYQAKCYARPLTPSEFAPELAKFLTNVWNKSYARPRNYFLCASRGAGTSLFDLLTNPGELGPWISKQWKDKNGDFGSFKQALSPELEAFISAFPFHIVKETTSSTLLEIHSRNHTRHWEKFGTLPNRGPNPDIPSRPTIEEQTYVRALLKVYAEEVGTAVSDISAIPLKHQKHFSAQRRVFYSAEGLSRFSRDKLPGAFGALLDEIETGIGPVLYAPYPSGMNRLTETMKLAPSLKIEANALKSRLQAADLPGACHHLANQSRITWTDDEPDTSAF
ncbi:ABC-three component system protein [Stigmatella aurantiaca]|uniref:ABC-three component system protein n=1 Tax=Stigmatella aurantiaca TaxID=41 RepID=UPI001C4311F7|nr:ABC-three component system protein [Stigmatella aurantiaca]